MFMTVYGVVGFSTTVKLRNLELGIEFRACDTHLLCICLVIAARLRFLTPETPLPQVSQKNKKIRQLTEWQNCHMVAKDRKMPMLWHQKCVVESTRCWKDEH